MIQMKLKRKYLSGFKSRHAGGERPAPRKKRNKLNDKAKAALAPQPKITLVVDGRTGKSHFERV